MSEPVAVWCCPMARSRPLSTEGHLPLARQNMPSMCERRATDRKRAALFQGSPRHRAQTNGVSCLDKIASWSCGKTGGGHSNLPIPWGHAGNPSRFVEQHLPHSTPCIPSQMRPSSFHRLRSPPLMHATARNHPPGIVRGETSIQGKTPCPKRKTKATRKPKSLRRKR